MQAAIDTACTAAPARWTRRYLKSRLVRAFQNIQGIAIHSPRMFETLDLDGARVSDLDLVHLTARYLPRDSEARLALLVRARAMARVVGLPASDWYRGKGWDYRKFMAQCAIAAEAIVEGLNRDGVALEPGAMLLTELQPFGAQYPREGRKAP
jgi:hypothetical protein